MAASDAQIIASYQATGEAAELGELLRRHIGRVRSLAFQITLNEAAADDITQEVFLSVMRGLKSFRSESTFSTWLYRITTNTAHAYLRQQRLQPRAVDGQIAEPPEHWPAPEQHAMSSELFHEIERALNELSPKLRAAIALTSMQQLSPAEAAAIEGCSTATMYWRVHQARKQLKQRLERHIRP